MAMTMRKETTMTENEPITKEALATLGAKSLVYIREVSARDVLAQIAAPELDGLDPDAILYAVHAADGSRLAILDDRAAAFAAARGHELNPVSVH
jgi:hypothetical protein